MITSTPHASRYGDTLSWSPGSLTARRWSHSASEDKPEENRLDSKNQKASHVPPDFFLNKQDLLSIVEPTEDTVDEHLQFERDPFLRGYAASDGPELTVSDAPYDEEFPSFPETRQGDDKVQRTVTKLWRAIRQRLGNPYKTDMDLVYDLYQQLPGFRMPYLHATIRHGLLKVLGREERNRKSMLRYFAVVEDVEKSGLRLTRSEWNTALSFTARYVGHSTEIEASAALKLWKEMEVDAGVKGNHVTFNILFDVASKAGNFVLAEMLYDEMRNRGFKYNRYHHVSLIHFFGLKMDSDGIRAAYKEMVEDGEMIDTTVLNCVIAGFLRCGEEYAAERVYERMKAAHERAPTMPYRNYMNEKIVTKVLQMFAQIPRGTEAPDLRRHFQKMSPIVPDLQTYRILLNHYAVRMSALDKVALFLDDMKWFQIPLHGAVFLALFKGFAMHGGPKGQSWSPQRLAQVYKAFKSALDDNTVGLYVDIWMAKWVLRAFKKCDHDRVWEVWNELRPYCETDFEPEAVQPFHEFLVKLLKKMSEDRKYTDFGMYGKSRWKWPD